MARPARRTRAPRSEHRHCPPLLHQRDDPQLPAAAGAQRVAAGPDHRLARFGVRRGESRAQRRHSDRGRVLHVHLAALPRTHRALRRGALRHGLRRGGRFLHACGARGLPQRGRRGRLRAPRGRGVLRRRGGRAPREGAGHGRCALSRVPAGARRLPRARSAAGATRAGRPGATAPRPAPARRGLARPAPRARAAPAALNSSDGDGYGIIPGVKLSARWIKEISANTWLRIGEGLLLVLAFLVNEAEYYQYRFIQQMELWAYDQRLRLFLPNTLDPRVVILDIDEKSLNAEGRWPWSRNKLAEMIRQLFDKYNVRVVGFDVAFPEADPSSGLASLDDMARTDLKDDAEFQRVLQARRPSLDSDRIFADQISNHPVVLVFFPAEKTATPRL